MKKKITKYYAADFEATTVRRKEDLNGFDVRVWGAGICEVGTEDIEIFSNIDEFFDYIFKIDATHIIIEFCNLKYDGSLMLPYILKKLKYTFTVSDKVGKDITNKINELYEDNNFKTTNKILDGEFSTIIDGMGNWYSIRMNYKQKIIQFNDSLKILPFSIDNLSKACKTKHKKLKGTIDYYKEREEGYIMDEIEKKYLINDILVLAEALASVKEYGLLDDKIMTIAQFAKKKYIEDFDKKKIEKLFPYDDEKRYDSIFRAGYRGGYCYVAHPNVIYDEEISIYDVNSLYPSVMHSCSGFAYPYGSVSICDNLEDFEKISDKNNIFYYIRIICKFNVKDGFLPFIQLKNTPGYKENEYVKSCPEAVELTFCKYDYELFTKHYDYEIVEFIGAWYQPCRKGLFDNYINKYYEMKKNAKTPGERLVAKLLLNSLYGKFSANPIGSSSVPYIDKDNKVHFKQYIEERKGFWIAAGAAITAAARTFIITWAQYCNDHGHEVLYIDTDSLHVRGTPEGLPVGKDMCQFKLENKADRARYVRQKTYIEHFIEEDGEKIEPRWGIKAAGAPDSVKERLLYKVELFEDLKRDENDKILNEKYTDDEFINRFTNGLKESHKLCIANTESGKALYLTSFEIR